MYSVEISKKDFNKAQAKYAVFKKEIMEFLESGVEHELVDDKLIVKCCTEDKDKLCKLLRFSDIRFTVDGKDVYRHLGLFDGELVILLRYEDKSVDPTKILEEIGKLGIELKLPDWEFAVKHAIAFKLKVDGGHVHEYNPFRQLQDLLDEYGIANEVCRV